ncbi:antibiotic biosynthesis monooxygenase family protein [Chloroflexota bacterium]
MYASLTTFKTAPNKRAEADAIADKAYPIISGMKGFKSVVYFGDPDRNEYGAFYTWETKEDLDAAYSMIAPKLQEMLGPIAIEPPTRNVYEVYEPKP